MKKTLLKYLILIVLTFAASIIIYEYVESSDSVDIEVDILAHQKEMERQKLSDTNYDLNDPKVILDVYGNSPLTAVVIFETKDLTPVTITVKGKDGGDDLTHTFLPNKVHILPIYGLYADYDNKVIIEASNTTKEITITTAPLPDDFAKVTDIQNEDFESDEFYFATPTDIGYTAAYDDQGEVRWYLTGDYKWDIQRLNNGHLLIGSDNIIQKPNYSIGLMEIDLLGKVYYEYDIPGGYHSSSYELSNGNLLLASNNLGSGTVEDYIVEIDRSSGEIVKEVDLYNIMPNSQGKNWFKMSSLVYNPNNNSLTIAGYNSNMIINIDYNTSEINYIIADKNDISEEYQEYLLQYDESVDLPQKPLSINIINDNEFAFINQIDNFRYLEVYEVDTENNTLKQIKKYKLNNNEDAYLDILGENHYLITQGHTISEIKNEQTIMSMDVNSNLYNTKKLSLYANDIFTVGDGIRLGTLNETETTKNHLLIFSKNEDIIDKYNISLSQNIYGLNISGTFQDGDDVEIILDNVLSKKTYDLDVYNSDGETASYYKFISNENISGKYYIYLKINNTIYKLHKYAEF